MTANKLEGKARELLAECLEELNATSHGPVIEGSLRDRIVRALDTARQSDAIHSCSYYCDRPECVKAQRDQLREAYVARQSEGMVLEGWMRDAAEVEGLANHLEQLAYRANERGDVDCHDQASAMAADVLRKVLLPLLAAAPADAGEGGRG